MPAGVDAASDRAIPVYWAPFGADSLLVAVVAESGSAVLRLRVAGGDLSGAAYAPEDGRFLGAVRGHRVDCPETD